MKPQNAPNQFDVAIIGAGPAGLTASIYTSRANLKTVFIEKDAPGGKMVKTFKIENWSGDKEVAGHVLSMRMFDHAQSIPGNKYMYGNVINLVSHGPTNHEVELSSGEIIKARSIIIATGLIERVPEQIVNIRKFENRGVSYCAICDGPLHKNQPIAIIGGGNSAIGEARYVSQFASHVYVFVRAAKDLIADEIEIKELRARPNVSILLNAQIQEINGAASVESITASINGEIKKMPMSGIFPYIGHVPITFFAKDLNITDERGYIKTDELMETSVKGIYAVGDVRVKEIRQISTAVADGTIAGKIIANRL